MEEKNNDSLLEIKNFESISYQLSTTSYGQIKAIPILLANDLNSMLEQWFQNYKFIYLAINQLSEEAYDKPLQLEYTYSLRNQDLREFSKIFSDVNSEVDLLNYHQIVKIIHTYIELAFKVYSSLNEEKQGDTILDFEKYIESKSKKFHRKSFPEKLEIIANDLALTTPLDILVQINRVRNCLEHRGGIVSQTDCDPTKNYMSITFKYLRIDSPNGEMSPISDVKGKQNIDVNFTNETKKFRLGEKIFFDFYDNTKLIVSINICFKAVIDGIYDLYNVNQNEMKIILKEFK